ncbi:MAG: phospholipase D-like domain-containing protein [Anaerolineales bacterium]|nr:phospholipase D-like domain-containing protein [Anaerolineales bacterium]
MKKTLTYILAFLILMTACQSVTPTETSAPPTPPTTDSATETSAPLIDIPLGAGYGVDGGWFELYFTNPESPLASQETGGVDAPLAAAIDSARLTVDVAIYSLSLNSIRDALIRAHKRGVQVRMVMESDNLDRSDPQKLKDAGIPILGDRRAGLMHDKFVVIDSSEVWLGSMNFTDSGGYTDNNNLMRIRSVKMAENYAKEFEEMFVDDKFGEDVVAETPNPRVTIDGTPIDVYFSPDDGVQASFVDLVNNAQQSIYFMAFSFTANEIGEAVRARADEGVTVAGVMETEQVNSNIGTEFDPFNQARLDVLRDGNEGQMHHKVMIIDENTVILGSYNFTNSAEIKNDETLIVIYNEEIAAQFMDEFQRVYAQAQAAR